MDSLEFLDFSSFVIFSDDPWSLLVSFRQLFKLPLVVQCCNVICEWPLKCESASRCFQPGEGPSRGFLCDCSKPMDRLQRMVGMSTLKCDRWRVADTRNWAHKAVPSNKHTTTTSTSPLHSRQ